MDAAAMGNEIKKAFFKLQVINFSCGIIVFLYSYLG